MVTLVMAAVMSLYMFICLFLLPCFKRHEINICDPLVMLGIALNGDFKAIFSDEDIGDLLSPKGPQKSVLAKRFLLGTDGHEFEATNVAGTTKFRSNSTRMLVASP